MPPVKRRRLNAAAGLKLKPADQAIRCRNELQRALARELAPEVSIIPHRSQWATAVARLGRFADQISVNIVSSPPASDGAAIWQIIWCANATALLMGAAPPSGTGAAPHTAVLRASADLVSAADRLAAVGATSKSKLVALFDVLSPMLEIYELCCFLRNPDTQRTIFHTMMTHSAQGGPADCLLMVTPILLPNLVSSIRYVADQIAKNS